MLIINDNDVCPTCGAYYNGKHVYARCSNNHYRRVGESK